MGKDILAELEALAIVAVAQRRLSSSSLENALTLKKTYFLLSRKCSSNILDKYNLILKMLRAKEK